MVRLVIETNQPCYWCQRPMAVLGDPDLSPTRDHVRPKRMRPVNNSGPVVIACFRCNNLKGDKTPGEWEAFMASHPEWWVRKVAVPTPKREPKPIVVEMPRPVTARKITVPILYSTRGDGPVPTGVFAEKLAGFSARPGTAQADSPDSDTPR